jgi:streptomycin 6-kinase
MPAPLTYAEWLTGVPALLAEVAQSWGLTPGRAYAPGACGHVVQVELPDGTPAVLKLSNPDRETLQEPDALERWDSDGAVRLIARDDDRHAMLLERCEPGTFLSASAEDALDVFVGLLPRLWKSGDGFATLEDEAAIWADDIERRETRDPKLRDAALAYLRELPSTQADPVLLHQDLHGENVLAADREPWLVIDPKPLAGEREVSVAPIVRSFELGHSKRDALYRLDRLTSELGLDRDRALGWTVAQTVAWSGGVTDYWEPHVETVRWLLEDA